MICFVGVAICLFRPSYVHAGGRRSYWLVLTQLLFYPLAIAIGAAFQANMHPRSEPMQPHRLGEHLPDVLTGSVPDRRRFLGVPQEGASMAGRQPRDSSGGRDLGSIFCGGYVG